MRYVMVLANDRLECSKCFIHSVYQHSHNGHSLIVDINSRECKTKDVNNNASVTPSKKKILICIVAILILVPLLLVPILNFQEGTKPEEENAGLSPTQAQQIANMISLTPSASGTENYRWNTYTGKGFTFQYPPDWNIRTYPIAESDVAIVIKPAVLPEGLEYPQFVLQTEVYTETGYQNKIGFLEGFKMQKSDYKIGVNEDAAVKYTGTIPFKIVGNQTVQEPIQDTSVLYRKDSQLYLFKFEYEGSTPNAALDNYFEDFIQSFKTT